MTSQYTEEELGIINELLGWHPWRGGTRSYRDLAHEFQTKTEGSDRTIAEIIAMLKDLVGPIPTFVVVGAVLTPPRPNVPPRKGMLAFNPNWTTFAHAGWRSVGADIGIYRVEQDQAMLALTGQGGMWVDGKSYGTCQFCPDGFRARAAHFIEKDPETVCMWLDGDR
jgi:hypothetical protein